MESFAFHRVSKKINRKSFHCNIQENQPEREVHFINPSKSRRISTSSNEPPRGSTESQRRR